MPAPAVVPPQNPYGPLVTFKSTDILPPSAIYVSPQDAIVINVIQPNVVTPITVGYRMLLANGTIVNTSRQFVNPVPGKGSFLFTIPPSEGFLLSMVISSDNIPPRGQSFVQAVLVPNANVNPPGLPPFSHCFLQGYVGQELLAFPQSTVESSLSGAGWLHLIQFPNKVGLPQLAPFPGPVTWLVRSVVFEFTASAAVGNRILACEVFDAFGNLAALATAPGTVAPGGSAIVTFAPGLANFSFGTFQTASLPEVKMSNQVDVLKLTALNLDVADVLGPSTITVEEWVGQ